MSPTWTVFLLFLKLTNSLRSFARSSCWTSGIPATDGRVLSADLFHDSAPGLKHRTWYVRSRTLTTPSSVSEARLQNSAFKPPQGDFINSFLCCQPEERNGVDSPFPRLSSSSSSSPQVDSASRYLTPSSPDLLHLCLRHIPRSIHAATFSSL